MIKPSHPIRFAIALFATVAFTHPNLRAANCAVDGGTYYQDIDGFGFSDGWSGTLSDEKNDALYNTLGFSILRAFINANASGGYITPVENIEAAHEAGALVFATGWPSTTWNLSTTNHLDPAYYATYANFLRTEASNKDIDYISPMNEPDNNTTSGTRWTPTEILNFIKNNARTIGTPIIMPEAVNFNDAYSDPVLNDATARNNVTFVGGHFYGNGNRVHTNAISKGKHVWETEHCLVGQDITTCMSVAKEVSDAMNNQFSAYCWWWVNDGDPDVTLVQDDGTINKNGYTLGQFAKWIRPGKSHIAATYNPNTNVYVTAYRGGGIVVVAINTGTSSVSQPFSFANISGLNSMHVHRTSSSQNMADLGSVSTGSGSFTYTLPAQSITTFHQY